MKYLVDTDWSIDFLNGRASAINLFAALAGDGIAISLMTLGELYEGILGSTDPRG